MNEEIIEEIKTKVCRKCEIEKEIINFKWRHNLSDGLNHQCNECKAKRAQLYFIKNKERILNHKKIYNLINKEKNSIQSKIYYINNKKEILEYKQNYRNNNKLNRLLITIKSRAKKNGIEFNLNKQDLILTECCPILNEKFILIPNKKLEQFSPSLDRIDPNKGYIKGNVRIISYKANSIKNDSTKQEIKNIIDYINQLIVLNKVIFNRTNFLKLKALYYAAKERSKKDNRVFNITFEDLKSLYMENCPVFGFPLNWNNKDIKQYNSPSLDRIDNTKGYEIGNVAIISYRANALKRDATLEELQLIHDRAFEPIYSPIFQSQENNPIIPVEINPIET